MFLDLFFIIAPHQWGHFLDIYVLITPQWNFNVKDKLYIYLCIMRYLSFIHKKLYEWCIKEYDFFTPLSTISSPLGMHALEIDLKGHLKYYMTGHFNLHSIFSWRINYGKEETQVAYLIKCPRWGAHSVFITGWCLSICFSYHATKQHTRKVGEVSQIWLCNWRKLSWKLSRYFLNVPKCLFTPWQVGMYDK